MQCASQQAKVMTKTLPSHSLILGASRLVTVKKQLGKKRLRSLTLQAQQNEEQQKPTEESSSNSTLELLSLLVNNPTEILNSAHV